MLSIFHEDDIDLKGDDAMKPSVIAFYNFTYGVLGGQDEDGIFYYKSEQPRAFNCYLLNMSGINSQTIFNSNTNTKLYQRI